MRIDPGRDPAELTMTNLDLEITIQIEEAHERGGAPFLVPFSAFAASAGVADKKSGKVRITYDEASEIAVFDVDGIAAKVRCLAKVDDFPDFTLHERLSMQEFEAPEGVLFKHLRMVRHCISSEETRYYLNGVSFQGHPETGSLRTVSTDGHRLGIYDSETDWPKGVKHIAPTDLVDAMLACLRKDGNQLATLRVSEDGMPFMGLECGDVSIRAKTIDGTFPDYTRVIPTHDTPNQINLTGAGLRKPLEIARAIHPGVSIAAKLDANKGVGSIRLVENIGESEVTFPIEAAHRAEEGDGVIGFNAKYLAEQGRITPVFRVNFGGSGDPALLTCEDPNAFFVLMPMRV
jgi:DNA polymerase-3 subunit beta